MHLYDALGNSTNHIIQNHGQFWIGIEEQGVNLIDYCFLTFIFLALISLTEIIWI